MPLYFAYGSNMEAAGLRARCPRSRRIGAAELPSHRFYLMAGSGYASVQADQGSSVHGVLIDLDPGDLAALDAYEDVAGGLYARGEREVKLAGGGAVLAMLYLGARREGGGRPPPGYMEGVVAAAREAALPPSYLAALAALLLAQAPGAAVAAW